jgi:hypothetical protein
MVTDPENIKVEEIKQEYLKEMRILLNDFAFELHAFEDFGPPRSYGKPT